MTARGNDLSPAKMIRRIRSVEIVFEDEMSACTDTGILDRSLELVLSDGSDDSTKCVDDLDHLVEKDVYDSVTLNADGDLSEDDSVSLKEREPPPAEVADGVPAHAESLTPHSCRAPLSPSVSELGDSGRFTEDASSAHFDARLACDDALLSHAYDVINVEPEAGLDGPRLYEYVDTDSESSDDTAACDADLARSRPAPPPSDSMDGFEQYDSFIDMGKF